MGSQVRILSIRLAWEYRSPWISPGREDARAVRPAAPAGGINTSVTTGKKGRRALANAGIQAPSGVQAPDVHSEASHPSFGWRTTRHRRATYPKKARPCGCGAVVARLLPKQETAGSNPVIRSIRKTKTMDLIQQWDSQPSFPCGRFRRKHGRTASAWARIVKDGNMPVASVAQRKSRCLLSTGSGYRNSVGARCTVNGRA